MGGDIQSIIQALVAQYEHQQGGPWPGRMPYQVGPSNKDYTPIAEDVPALVEQLRRLPILQEGAPPGVENPEALYDTLQDYKMNAQGLDWLGNPVR